LFRKFGEHLNNLDERTINQDYFDAPEGIDVLMKATEQSTRTRSEEKRELIARILAGATSTDAGRGEYSPEEYLNIVADLTDKELEIARTIYTLQRNISPTELEPKNKAGTWSKCVEAIAEKHDIGASVFPLLLNRLYAAGLLDLFTCSIQALLHRPIGFLRPSIS
jgi:hypothetical protein